MKILGISSWFHDSSAALLVDGEILGYAEEERFNRDKHTPAYPQHAIDWVLSANGLNLDDIDEVVYYLNPGSYLWTGLKAVLASFPRSLALLGSGSSTVGPLRRLWYMSRLKEIMCRQHNARGRFKIVFLDHYKTHQGSAFYPSGFDDAAILTMDFAVDGTTEVIAHGAGTSIDDKVKHHVPHGFAMIYATVTHALGFKWYDEYKVMGMSAYGQPKYLDAISRLYELDESTGRLRLDLRYFEFHKSGRSRLYSERMQELFGAPRQPNAPITQREYDLSASLQAATSKYGLAMARLARKITNSANLCLAGGVAQNCLMNQAICDARIFDQVFLQPLAGDVGGSIGGALYQYHHQHQSPRKYRMTHLYLGPSYGTEIPRVVSEFGLVERKSENWHEAVARAVADGLIVGLFCGRMEAGPRALGARSIIADPRRADMKDTLNARVKHREHFRPFAPSVLAEEVTRVFEPLPGCRSLEFMIVTLNVREEWRSKVPAITHNDGTARVQAVSKEHASDYHDIISHFYALTGVPLVINTSFNDNEPIVCTPADAVNCFLRTHMDLLVLDGKLFFRQDNSGASQKARAST